MSTSSESQSEKECPLCMEALEIDDVDFYPCKCGYQICRFCWHRIRTDENGLCPACRQPYPEDPVNFKPLSTADVQRIKSEKKMKRQAEKMKVSESRKHLASYRVLQKNLVYVIGLSARVADAEILKKPEYFGRFGKIIKVVVGAPSNTAPQQAANHTAYVTYTRVEDALRAIQGVSNVQFDGRTVKASLGTTKYCSSFLRSQPCYKPECMYLHEIAESELSFTKEDMQHGKHNEYEKKLMETLLRASSGGVSPLVPSLTNGTSSALKQTSWNTRNGWEKGKKKEEGDMGKSSSRMTNGMKADGGTASRTTPVPRGTSRTASRNSIHNVADGVNGRDDSVEDPEENRVQLDATKKTDEVALDEGDVRRGSTSNWQQLLGLMPRAESPPTTRAYTPPHSDDDLGFDPFSESAKGLAVLLEEEQTRYAPPPDPRPMLRSVQQQPAPPPLWQQPMSRPFDIFSSSTPSLDPYTSDSFAPPGFSRPQTLNEWQQGLKALLPNVNVRFASELGSGAGWGSSSTTAAPLLHHAPPMHPYSYEHSFSLQQPIPPPPGFSAPNR